MEELWDVLGYGQPAERIAEELQVGQNIAVLEGPPGVGKSLLATRIAALWEEAGGSAVLAEGDRLRADAAFYPLSFATGDVGKRLRSAAPAVASIARAGETLLGTAGLITSTVEALLKVGRPTGRSRTMLLNPSEQTIVHELSKLSRGRPLLIVADNLHWWDKPSLDLLGRLRDLRMWEAFPFLGELRVLAVETTPSYQPVVHPDAHDSLLKPLSTCRYLLPRVPSDRFVEVLVCLGADPAPTSDLADAIYSLCGGHLALSAQCAPRLGEQGAALLAAGAGKDFITALLRERVRTMGPAGERAVPVLQVAALLGLAFSRRELHCAVGSDEAETGRVLRECRSEGLIAAVGGLERFAHDVYRQHFLELAGTDAAEINARISGCLRQLRPGDYELRSLTALGAEEDELAATLAVQNGLQQIREGRRSEDQPDRLGQAILDVGLDVAFARLSEALRHLNGYRFADCLSELDGLPHRVPKPLVAEGDYLRAMCLMSTRSEHDRGLARSILAGWSGYEEEEPELGARLMLLLLYGCCHVADKTEGWALERQITRSLSSRASFDVGAEDALYTLDRKSGGLHPPDAALIRTREAASHFGPAEGEIVLRRPVEYYRCLVNYGAKLIENGRYTDAVTVHDQLQDLIDSYPGDVFPRVDHAQTNRLLVQYRAGAVRASQAFELQRDICARGGEHDDPFYVRNALAVYLALAGEAQAALEALGGLAEQLERTRDNPEPSMTYLIQANRCAVKLIVGEREGLAGEWAALSSLVRQSNYTDRDVLALRHDLLMSVFNDAPEDMSAEQFDSVLLREHPDRAGPLWAHFGRGFGMPAIEFWREN